MESRLIRPLPFIICVRNDSGGSTKRQSDGDDLSPGVSGDLTSDMQRAAGLLMHLYYEKSLSDVDDAPATKQLFDILTGQ